MKLTQRDLEIFKLMSAMAILTTAQLQQAVFSSIAATTVLRRLRKLERGRYIQRIKGLPSYEVAWALTQKGADAVGYGNPKRNFHRLSLVHDVMLADLRLTLEGHGIARSWIPEHEIRSLMARKHGLKKMKTETVPDGIMSISYQGVMESVAVELELHYKNQDRYKQIFEAYRWKENIKAVWYFVPSKSLGRHLEKLWMKSGVRSTPWLLWSEVDDVLTNGGMAVVHYFNDRFEIGKLFDAKTIGESPAHPGGFGVSNLGEGKTGKQIDLSSETQGELPAKAS